MATLSNINQHYYIVARSAECKKGRLLGRSGLLGLVGEELAFRLLQRAERAKSDKITMKLRRGVQLDWYVK